MKFKDKNGNVYSDIKSYYKNVCRCHAFCDRCPLYEIYEKSGGSSTECLQYVVDHPYDFAQILGLEIIEDEEVSPYMNLEQVKEYCERCRDIHKGECDFEKCCFHKMGVCSGTIPAEWALDSETDTDVGYKGEWDKNPNIESVPILCNIVGVKPYDRFYVCIDILEFELYIDDLGYMRYARNKAEVSSGILVQIINNPECIMKKTSFTLEEKMIADVFKSCFENGEQVTFCRDKFGYLAWSVNDFSYTLPEKLFPSIENEESYTAEMILGEDLK